MPLLWILLGAAGFAAYEWWKSRRAAPAPAQLPPAPAQAYVCDSLTPVQCTEVLGALMPSTVDVSYIVATANKYRSYNVAYSALMARAASLGYQAPAAQQTGAAMLPPSSANDLAAQACYAAWLMHQTGKGGGGGGGGHPHGGWGGGGGGGGWHGHGGHGRRRGFGGGWGWWGPGWWPAYDVSQPALDPVCQWAMTSADSGTLQTMLSQYADQPDVVACLSQRIAALRSAGL